MSVSKGAVWVSSCPVPVDAEKICLINLRSPNFSVPILGTIVQVEWKAQSGTVSLRCRI